MITVSIHSTKNLEPEVEITLCFQTRNVPYGQINLYFFTQLSNEIFIQVKIWQNLPLDRLDPLQSRCLLEIFQFRHYRLFPRPFRPKTFEHRLFQLHWFPGQFLWRSSLVSVWRFWVLERVESLPQGTDKFVFLIVDWMKFRDHVAKFVEVNTIIIIQVKVSNQLFWKL